jgi:benzylsuccinate CoA-transferase BbsF subunit
LDVLFKNTQNKTTEPQILSGFRVLDFSWVLAGPFATRLLADFGAEVIKVHPLSSEPGDRYSRGYYNTWNRNKLGITLNLGHPEGLEIARSLVKISDAVVENFTPRVMANWGMSYPELKILKPDIILLSMSVMGHSGPWQDYTGFGPTVQAFSGITGLTASPGCPPSGIGYSYSDHVAGLYAALALLGALEYRLSTGHGQFIDLSQTEAMTGLLSSEIVEYTLEGREPQPVGNSSLKCAPHGIYRCLGDDRWCAIAVSTPEEWEGFKRAAGNPPWTDERRFAALNDRLANAGALDSLVQEWTHKHSSEEVTEVLQKEGVPAGVVRNAADLAQDPQLLSRNFFVELEHPVLGMTVSDASPVRLSNAPPQYRRAAPEPGQDNDYVFRQLLGLSKKQFDRLRRDKII